MCYESLEDALRSMGRSEKQAEKQQEKEEKEVWIADECKSYQDGVEKVVIRADNARVYKPTQFKDHMYTYRLHVGVKSYRHDEKEGVYTFRTEAV